MNAYFLLNVFFSFTFVNAFFYFQKYSSVVSILCKCGNGKQDELYFWCSTLVIASARAWSSLFYFYSLLKIKDVYFVDGVLVIAVNSWHPDTQNTMFSAFLWVVEYLLQGECRIQHDTFCLYSHVRGFFVCTYINQERSKRFNRFIFTFTVIPHVLSHRVSLVVHGFKFFKLCVN